MREGWEKRVNVLLLSCRDVKVHDSKQQKQSSERFHNLNDCLLAHFTSVTSNLSGQIKSKSLWLIKMQNDEAVQLETNKHVNWTNSCRLQLFWQTAHICWKNQIPSTRIECMSQNLDWTDAAVVVTHLNWLTSKNLWLLMEASRLQPGILA